MLLIKTAILLFSLLRTYCSAWSETFLETATVGSELLQAVYDPPDPSLQRSATVDQIEGQGFEITDKLVTNDDYTKATERRELFYFAATIDEDNKYEFYVDFPSGLVIIEAIYRSRKDLYTWSEVLHTLYKHFAPRFDTTIGNIKTIVVYDVGNAPTLRIMKEIKPDWGDMLEGDGFESKLHPKSTEWNAIVGSQSNRGIAYFLSQHRDDLPGMNIETITLAMHSHQPQIYFGLGTTPAASRCVKRRRVQPSHALEPAPDMFGSGNNTSNSTLC